ncbi:MAG: hypothetical protein HOO06_03630 [Bdellovibrionaceae bacterium]|jgi:hypothetical protein|nr:hypothetical protein [Pseudobdellovibrionaceae bacterium]
MWCRLGLFGFVLFELLFSQYLFAQSLAFSRNARTFESVHSSLFVKSLGHACLSITISPDSLPCNPANMVYQDKNTLGADLLLSNGHSALSNIRQLLDGEISQGLVDTLFTEGKIIQIEANVDINFKSKYINARYTPFTVKGFSVVRNEANPDVELSAVEEKGFALQSAYQVIDGLSIGVQVRFLERKFVRQQFQLILMGTPAGDQLLSPKSQKVTYIEPGMTWEISNNWHPRLSVLVANLGFVSDKHDELNVPVDYQVGFGITPPIRWGELQLALDYKSLTLVEADQAKFRFGGTYGFGAMHFATGLDVNGVSGGIFYGLQQATAGVMYSTTRITNEDEDYFTQTLYVQLGWRI